MPHTSDESKSNRFAEDFFDSGRHVPGTFERYSFAEYCQTFKPLTETIVKHFCPRRVLDVGCAKGSLVCAFRESGVEAFGVDISEYAISSAPMSLQSFLTVVDLDKNSLPFKNDFFDFVTFLGSIEYLRNHKHVIAELERVMVDDGSMFLTTLYRQPEGDIYRFNVHSKAFWLEEFERWSIPSVYYAFMGDYFQSSGRSKFILSRAKKLLFGKSRFTDAFFVFLWDIFTKLHILNYGVILLTLHKSKG